MFLRWANLICFLAIEIIFTKEELKAIVDVFHKKGKKIGAHVAGKDGIDLAIECGIDVEMVNPEVDYELMSRRILTKEEYFTYLHQRRAAYFTMMWTKKEAMFKYIGTGIVLNHFKLLDISKVQTIELDDSKNNLYYLSYRTADGEEVEDIRRIII